MPRPRPLANRLVDDERIQISRRASAWWACWVSAIARILSDRVQVGIRYWDVRCTSWRPPPGPKPLDHDHDQGPTPRWSTGTSRVTTAKRLVRPGPEIRRRGAQRRRRAAATQRQSEEHVRGFTGLHARRRRPRPGRRPVGWVQANADGFRQILRRWSASCASGAASRRVSAAVGSRVTGLEAGGLLAFLSNKVLGQFEPFSPGPPGRAAASHGGRLLLVAPNIVHVERELGVDPRDFRLWVCLHEETHRVQFTAVPWLREHLLSRDRGLLASDRPRPGELAGDAAVTASSAVGRLVTRRRGRARCSTSCRPRSSARSSSG